MVRRITRKQLKQDEFVSSVDTMMRWLLDNWRPFAIALAAVAVGISLWWVGQRWSSSRSDEASYELYEALRGLESEGEQASAAASDSGGDQALQQVIDRYGRSEQADTARVYLARRHMDRGEEDAARDLLVDLLNRNTDNVIARVATLDLIHLRLASGEGAEVARELEAMAAGSDRRLPRDTALYELAELSVRESRIDGARKYFDTLVTEFPESPYLELARKRLAELG